MRQVSNNHLRRRSLKSSRFTPKFILSCVLAMIMLVTSIPIFPGSDLFTSVAHASTNVRIIPSEINTDKGEITKIHFSFNAADSGADSHPTNINLCTPQANGAAPILGDLIKSGVYQTKDAQGNYIQHVESWDGKINGAPLAEGRYNICVSPASYNGVGVYYGQITSFEIVNTVQPKVPVSLEVLPATAGGQAIITGERRAVPRLKLSFVTPREMSLRSMITFKSIL